MDKNKTFFAALVLVIIGLIGFIFLSNLDPDEEVTSELIENVKEMKINGLSEDFNEKGFYEALSISSGTTVYADKSLMSYSIKLLDNSVEVYYGYNMIDKVNFEIANEDLFQFDVKGNHVSILGLSELGVSTLPTLQSIEIPNEFEGKPVTVIRELAFANLGFTGDVIIPKNVKRIERGAFDGNGLSMMSRNIDGEPYEGAWRVKHDKWVKKR